MSDLFDSSKEIPVISIVDDDKSVRVALEGLMRSLGHNVSTFGSAEEFLESEKLHDTSCLITDLQMPGLNGIDLQSRLNAQGHRIPVIFITGRPEDNVRTCAMNAGAVGFFAKPVRARSLIECIEKALQAA
jgi:FixJ family two-component response regulator